MVQREYMIVNLGDAIEELQRLQKALEDPEYTEFEFKLDLAHAYHHINFAWNARDASDDELVNLSDSNFSKWSKFPIGEVPEFPSL